MKKRVLAAMAMTCALFLFQGINGTAAEATVKKGTVSYTYLEQETVSLNEEQQLLIGVESNETIQEAELYYRKAENGHTYQTSSKQISGNAALFSVKHTKKSQQGIYILDKIVYETKNGQKYEAQLSDGKEMKFGIGKEVNANPDAYLFEDTPDVGLEMITVDNGNVQRTESVSSKTIQAIGNEISNTKATQPENSADVEDNIVVVLDPGHGGRDPGVVRTYNGVTYYERNIVLTIAEYCKEELEKYNGVEVYMTRTDNTSALMDRWERTQFALGKGADYIVSLHINSTASSYSSVNGAMVYCPLY